MRRSVNAGGLAGHDRCIDGLLLPVVDGHVPVTGRDEDELPRLRHDSDNITEIVSLEEVERLPGEHLVELGLIDA